MRQDSCWFVWRLLLLASIPAAAGAGGDLRIVESPGQVALLAGDEPVGVYVYQDEHISRPYFKDLHSPGGVRVTRNHPPRSGYDRMDHPEYHPGLWMAFGDLRPAGRPGTDNWRLKAPVRHACFVERPLVEAGVARFTVENHYVLPEGGEEICRERAEYTLRSTDNGWLLTWDSRFTGDAAFSFGDQEEMGLGLRLASPLRVELKGRDPAVEGTGEIVDDQGRKNAAGVWGHEVRWLNYHGVSGGTPAGVAIFCHPANPYATRMHARDYGFVAANPFSLAAFNAGEPRLTTVQPGETMRLRYGLLLHSGRPLDEQQVQASYDHYRSLDQR